LFMKAGYDHKLSKTRHSYRGAQVSSSTAATNSIWK
jgi:hypothetical protein